MNVSKRMVLALSSIVLFFAGSATGQVGVKNYYALEIQGSVGEVLVASGQPNMPVAFLVGVDEVFVPIPGNATLRVDPLAIFVVGRFDDFGMYKLGGFQVPIVEPVRFLIQAASISEDGDGTFLTSELVEVYTNFYLFWRYTYLD